MATERATLVDELRPYAEWNQPANVREAAESMLGVLQLIYTIRQRNQVEMRAIDKMGAHVMTHFVNEVKEGCANIAQYKYNFRNLVLRHRSQFHQFANLDCEIADSPFDFYDDGLTNDGL